jgi:hypothetical protein
MNLGDSAAGSQAHSCHLLLFTVAAALPSCAAGVPLLHREFLSVGRLEGAATGKLRRLPEVAEAGKV